MVLLRYSFSTLNRLYNHSPLLHNPLINPGSQNTRKQPFLREITIPDSQQTVPCEFKVRANFKFAQAKFKFAQAMCELVNSRNRLQIRTGRLVWLRTTPKRPKLNQKL